MKALVLFLALLSFAVILANQPWDRQPAPTTPGSSPTSQANWLPWTPDKQLPELQQRLAQVEERLQKGLQEASLAQRVAETEQKLAQMAAIPPASLQMDNGFVLVKKGDSNWKLTDIFARLRQFRQRVTFAKPFAQPPRIMLGITLIELPAEKLRLQTRAEEIDSNGFTLVFESRSESRIEEMQVDWFAFADRAAAQGTQAR
ncbi:MAG: H-type lectin domain-containing protein [Magnetococcales bacterium]|nr:H-type lectin domain-containing protein [Magnetococcales bacterium]MBF0114092.1 H-type lectin domain-containing protein [Magnetococcales bacterium]